jgi:hypothetical protein
MHRSRNIYCNYTVLATKTIGSARADSPCESWPNLQVWPYRSLQWTLLSIMIEWANDDSYTPPISEATRNKNGPD